ncbi:low temperature requirement protein A [Algivirga pacifica]|uniref:Low temperature requirement protein A n=1 Tax=Algivirga pacifica TaxID=1162670 RepID=A0ABP9DLQ9_9BACT
MSTSKKIRLYLNEERKATWLELFFDLIFVVALGKTTHLLSHTHHGHLEEGSWVRFIIVFIPLWWIWVGHTVFSNRFDADERPHRLATLLLMFLLIILSVLINEDIGKNYQLFIAVYSIARLFIAGFYFLASKDYPDNADYSKKRGFIFSIGALICLSAVLFPLPYASYIFYIGLAFDILSPFLFFRNTKHFPIDKDHLVERVGLLAIILLGESIISLSQGIEGVDWETQTIVTAIVGFLLLCMIWWIYFDSFPFLLESKLDANGFAILYSQLMTYMAFAILANAIRHAILDDLVLIEFRIMALAGIVLFYLGKQTAYFFNVMEYRQPIIQNTLITFVIVGASLWLPSAQYILIGICCSMGGYIVLNYFTQLKLYGKASM